MTSQTIQLKVSVAAARLGVSPYTLYAWIAAHRIAHVRYGRTLRIPESEVRRLLREGLVKPNPKGAVKHEGAEHA